MFAIWYLPRFENLFIQSAATLNIYFNLTEKGVLVPVSELIKRLVPYKNEYSGYSSLDNLTSMNICVNFVPET
jgi:hypothetical protein